MSRKMTTIKYKESLKKKYGNKYSLLSECNSSTDKVLLKHNECGKTFTKIANEFTRSRVVERYNKFCPECKPDKERSKEDIQNELDSLTNNRIEIINKASKMQEMSDVKCKVCGYEWDTPLHSLIQNVKTNKTDAFGCPKCSQKKKKTTEEYKKEVFDKLGNDVSVMGEYINANENIDMFCNICDKEYRVRPVDLLYKDQKCPHCVKIIRESKNVKYIKSVLEELNIEYEQEVEFEECKNIYNLPFDFYVPIGDDFVLIEYDGEQHFRGWNGNKEELAKNIVNDNIKNKFCEEYEIPLLRLNYRDNKKKIREKLIGFLK